MYSRESSDLPANMLPKQLNQYNNWKSISSILAVEVLSKTNWKWNLTWDSTNFGVLEMNEIAQGYTNDFQEISSFLWKKLAEQLSH